jgi:hypothetical protein
MLSPEYIEQFIEKHVAQRFVGSEPGEGMLVALDRHNMPLVRYADIKPQFALKHAQKNYRYDWPLKIRPFLECSEGQQKYAEAKTAILTLRAVREMFLSGRLEIPEEVRPPGPASVKAALELHFGRNARARAAGEGER